MRAMPGLPRRLGWVSGIGSGTSVRTSGSGALRPSRTGATGTTEGGRRADAAEGARAPTTSDAANAPSINRRTNRGVIRATASNVPTMKANQASARDHGEPPGHTDEQESTGFRHHRLRSGVS